MSSKKTTTVAVSPTISSDLARQVERVERAAASIPAAEIKVCRCRTALMPTNIRYSIASLTAAEVQAKLEELFPELDFRGLWTDLTEGAEVVDYLAKWVGVDAAATASQRGLLAQGCKLLAKLDAQVAAAVAWEIIPEAKAEALPRSNRGSPIAMGHRIVGCAMLLKGYLPQLEGRVFVDAGCLDDAVAVGMSLRDLGAAKQSRVGRKKEGPMALRRDRVYTWLDGRYDLARGLGAVVFGKKVNSRVPPLTSCWVTRHKAASSAPAAEAPTAVAAAKEEVAPVAAPASPIPALAKVDAPPTATAPSALTIVPGAPAPATESAGARNAA
jgi:hypothetical protein